MTSIFGNSDMKIKFTRYFAAIEFITPLTYNRFLIIAVLVVVSGASRPIQPSNSETERAWLSVPICTVYSQYLVYGSTDTNYLIPEDDKVMRGKFTEFAGPTLPTDFKHKGYAVIDRNIDDFVYSINPLPYSSTLGFTHLRSPPCFS